MPMTNEQARSVKRPPIAIGGVYTFYAEMQEEYVPADKRMRRFTGQSVTVLRTVDTEDPDCSPLYAVRAIDGTEFDAWEEELNGWDRDLGQFFWTDGTYGPNHDRTFLANERGDD